MWDTLGIERTTDQRKIKRSYARLVAKYHPEEYPEKFQEIHQAYERALRYARFCREREEEKKQLQNVQADIASKKQEQRKSLQSNSVDFKSYNWIAGEPEEKVIRRLLHQVEYLMYSENVIQVEAWERILQSEEFQKYYLEPSFYKPLCRLLNKVKYHIEIAETIIQNLDLNELQRRYGEEEKKKFEDGLMHYAKKYQEREILKKFRNLVSSMRKEIVREWKVLLESKEFQQIYLEESFLFSFFEIMENTSLSKDVVEVLYQKIDMHKIQMKYEERERERVEEILRNCNITYEEESIMSGLLNKFRQLINSKKVKNTREWKRLLKSEEYQKYYLRKHFFLKFLHLLESAKLTKRVKNCISRDVNMILVQKKYGAEIYKRTKRVLCEKDYLLEESLETAMFTVIKKMGIIFIILQILKIFL